MIAEKPDRGTWASAAKAKAQCAQRARQMATRHHGEARAYFLAQVAEEEARAEEYAERSAQRGGG